MEWKCNQQDRRQELRLSIAITDTFFWYNDAQYSSGGGLNLAPQNTSASVTLKGVNVQVNTADMYGDGANEEIARGTGAQLRAEAHTDDLEAAFLAFASDAQAVA